MRNTASARAEESSALAERIHGNGFIELRNRMRKLRSPELPLRSRMHDLRSAEEPLRTVRTAFRSAEEPLRSAEIVSAGAENPLRSAGGHDAGRIAGATQRQRAYRVHPEPGCPGRAVGCRALRKNRGVPRDTLDRLACGRQMQGQSFVFRPLLIILSEVTLSE